MQTVLKNADRVFNNAGEVYANTLGADNLKLE